jgi:DNA-binding NarL/FixJ family response regulator
VRICGTASLVTVSERAAPAAASKGTWMIRVLVVDDHSVVREGMARLLATAPDIELVGCAADGNEALHLVLRDRPDLVVMDIGMPVLDGVGATRLITGHDPGVRVLLLTASADSRIDEAMQAGACGFVLKDADVDEVLDAVRAAATGNAPDRRDTGRARLSRRESQVLGLLVQGLTNRQIGAELGIAERTVRSHVEQVFRATGSADRVQAALWAREHSVAQEC